MLPTVSVIIPNFNNGNILERAIISCFKQDYKNIEIVVIDDASTDDSWDKIKLIKKKFPKLITVALPENVGPLQARLAGLIESKGDLIVFLDPDDELFHFKLSKAVFEHLNNKVDISIYAYEKQEEYTSILCLPGDLKFREHVDAVNFFWNKPFRYLWGKIYNRNVILSHIDEIKSLSFRHNEDVLANYIILYRNKNLSVATSNQVLVRYHVTYNGITKNNSFKNQKDAFCAIKWINDDIALNYLRPINFSDYFFSKFVNLIVSNEADCFCNTEYIKHYLSDIFINLVDLSLKNKIKLFFLNNFIIASRRSIIMYRTVKNLLKNS